MLNLKITFIISSLFMIITSGCSEKAHESYKISYFKAQLTNWNQILSKPSSITIETLKTGDILAQKSSVLNLKHPLMKGVTNELIRFGVYAHLIHHEKNGYYLIDTGFDSSFSEKNTGNFKGLFASLYLDHRYLQEKGQGIEIQIKERGLKLQGVFLTHFHEHICGIPSLPQDILYVYGKGEKEINFPGLFYTDFMKNLSEIKILDFSAALEIPPLGKVIDLFGDGSLWAISTPGHTAGHVSFLINSKTGPILITGDASITRFGFEHGVEPGKSSSDIFKSRESLFKLTQFVREFPQTLVIFGHEI